MRHHKIAGYPPLAAWTACWHGLTGSIHWFRHHRPTSCLTWLSMKELLLGIDQAGFKGSRMPGFKWTA